MKKIIKFLLLTAILTSMITSTAFADESIKVMFDNQLLTFDTNPVVINGRTMVPMRTIFEKLGYDVYYNQTTQEITASKGTTDIILYPNNTTAIVAVKYPEEIQLDVAPTIINGRTLVPLRFVAEAAGTIVDWDNNTRTVSINLKGSKYQDYSQDNLKALVENTPVDSAITEFRNKDNPRRNGLNKLETKYFDIYYPKTTIAQEMIDYISNYADTVYMFLTELYGQQVPVEVHLIKESDAVDLKEGDIRRNEKVTFVFINEENTKDLTSALYEMVHEMNHNFFSIVNNDWDKNDDKYSYFVDEGIARIVGAIYLYPIEEFNAYNGNFNLNYLDSNIREIKMNINRTNFDPSLDETASFLFKTWYTKNPKERIMRDSCIVTWMYLYDTYGPDKLEEIVRNMGQKDFKSKVEDIYNINLDELYEELY